MSDTFGQPSFTPSNMAGRSGVTSDQMGRLGSGVLQTIEEGIGALDGNVFYYPKTVGYFQLPSVQRSFGDDRRTINVKSFGNSGTVTLPKRHFMFGPAFLHLRLPIEYRWAGCEYTAKTYVNPAPIKANTIGDLLRYDKAVFQQDAASKVIAQGVSGEAEGAQVAADQLLLGIAPYLNQSTYFCEVPGCDTLLPTSFQSGGMGLALINSVDLELGGAGKISLDRYSNFAALMASTPYKSQRAEIMRMAGGGLDLWDEREAKNAPVRWGVVRGYNAAGNQSDIEAFPVNDFTDGLEGRPEAGVATTTTPIQRYVPVEWDIIVPIKTPDTNFHFTSHRRKPLDSTCFSGDLRYQFNWGSFFEVSDTGRGYPNAPVYLPHQLTSLFLGGAAHTATATYTNASRFELDEPQFVGPQVIGPNFNFRYTVVPNDGYFVCWTRPMTEMFQSFLGGPVLEFAPYETRFAVQTNYGGDHDPDTGATHEWRDEFLCNQIKRNPRIWTNHYRVAAGRQLSAVDKLGSNSKYPLVDNQGVSEEYAGRPRYPQLVCLWKEETYPGFNEDPEEDNGRVPQISCMSAQPPADVINNPDDIRYPDGFTFAEWVNSSLKLTNPSLGAYSRLRVDKEAVLPYPFQYMYAQSFRIAQHPYANIKNWTLASRDQVLSVNADLYSDNRKITQMIQMPANPVTSMIVAIYREKDRQFNPKNRLNSYSPVLFWNALAPLKMTLWDGGNILFDFESITENDLYGMFDRPDALRVPFKGGLCKLSPKGLYVDSGYATSLGGCIDEGYSGVLHEMSYTYSEKAPNNPAYNPTPQYGGFIGRNTLGRLAWFGQTEQSLWVSYGVTSYSNCAFNAGSRHPFAPAETCSAYPADTLAMQAFADPLGKRSQPCHLTDTYEACLMEFPFVMQNPLVSEKIVQSTPSFAKTQLRLEFWISPKLKPDNGLDDQYSTTYGLTRAACSGIGALPLVVGGGALTSTFGFDDALTYPGATSHPVPDCLRVCAANPDSCPDLLGRADIVSSTSDKGMTSALERFRYANGFNFADANSWNINNGNLMLHVTFCQNQVWLLSPLRTSILSARG